MGGWGGRPYHGAVRNTQTFLVMCHDRADGRMYLEDDRLRIAWPGVGEQPIFELANQSPRCIPWAAAPWPSRPNRAW